MPMPAKPAPLSRHAAQRLHPWRQDVLFFGPMLALALGLLVIRGFDLDRRWADLLFHLQGGHWQWRDAWLTARVLHEYGQRFSITWGIGLLALTGASAWHARLRTYTRGLVCLCIAVLTSLVLVSAGKHLLALPCPWDLARYGGDVIGAGVYALYPDAVGGCFPAGHAAGGYCLFALYFFARQYRLPMPSAWLLPGLVVGLAFGLAQELRGAHFLSHDLVSAGLCWFVGYMVFYIAFARADRRARNRLYS